MGNVKRSLVSKYNIGDTIYIPYMDYIHNQRVLFEIVSLPNKFINTARFKSINLNPSIVKDEVVDLIKPINK